MLGRTETEINQDKKKRLALVTESDAVERCISISYILSFLFGFYAFSSLIFIQKFDPSVTLWSNLWPRLLFNSLPLFLLGRYLTKSKKQPADKLLIWITAFSCILHVAAWIYIWPIALTKTAEVLTYVHAANVYLIAIVFAGISPPKFHLWKFAAVLSLLFLFPFGVVTYFAGDTTIGQVIGNDLVSVLVSIYFLSRLIEKLRYKLAKIEMEREEEASKFLGPFLSRAIFKDEHERLRKVYCKGFIICMDLRDSTDLQQKYGKDWFTFRRKYFELVSKLVMKHGGYIQKTVGDCHVINFGVMDYGIDLTDIPGIQDELDRADERRLERASNAAFSFLDEFFPQFEALGYGSFPEGVRIGAGIDKGLVERAVQGDSHNLEIDVNGDPVNCSSRLQEYSKYIFNMVKSDSSILVVSPFASDYLQDLQQFKKVMTEANPIRNYQKIKWVLVKDYASQKRLAPEKSAA